MRQRQARKPAIEMPPISPRHRHKAGGELTLKSRKIVYAI